MAFALETVRVYLDPAYIGVITCPHCRTKKSITMAEDKASVGNKTFKVKCGACAKVFGVNFDLRRYHRLPTSLPGHLFQLGVREAAETITIASLSVGGLQFVTTQPLRLHPGEVYDVVFCLNDPSRSMIMEEIIIRRIKGNRVGAEFHPAHAYSHALDFYLGDEVADL